jgi:hypothetical protein
MTTIEIGASRETLLKLADDIRSTFSVPGEREVTLYGESNDSRSEEITVRFSNEDMEDRADLTSGACFVEVDE